MSIGCEDHGAVPMAPGGGDPKFSALARPNSAPRKFFEIPIAHTMGSAKELEGRMGNTKAYLIALCIVVATVGQCFAEEITGNDIRDWCQVTLKENQRGPWTDVDTHHAGFCQGFVYAILVLGDALPEPIRCCHPKEATLEQSIRVLLKYLNEHPDLTHEDAVHLSLLAFKAAWPCH